MKTVTVPAPTVSEAYDKIVEYFSRPDAEIARDAELNQCQYRTEGTNGQTIKCAVGCLIPDAVYNPLWDNSMYGAEYVCSALGWHSSDLVSFLLEVQHLHDSSEYADEFVNKLKNFRAKNMAVFTWNNPL